MNETQNSKTAIIKTLAIIGFFVTAALLVWVVIQGLRFAPSAFSSLASIAESVQNYKKVGDISITTEKDIVVSGESFKLNWTDLKQPGTYTFSYTCTEGTTVEVRDADGNLVTVPCTETLSLPRNVQGLFVSISSEKQRFVDVPFTIAFKNERGETVTDVDGKMTVVNATIPLVVPTPTPATTTPEKPVVVPVPKPTTPVVQKPPVVVVTPTLPVSNPNGYTDLSIRFLGIGLMDGNTFTPHGTFDMSERNGLKFEIKNMGTKTSGPWSFKTELPGGVLYESPTQVALLPGEGVEFTIGFTLDATSAKTVSVTSTAIDKTDINTKNNSFTWAVAVTK